MEKKKGKQASAYQKKAAKPSPAPSPKQSSQNTNDVQPELKTVSKVAMDMKVEQNILQMLKGYGDSLEISSSLHVHCNNDRTSRSILRTMEHEKINCTLCIIS